MKPLIIFAFLLFTLPGKTTSQQVDNPAFEALLSTLLDNHDNKIRVDQLAKHYEAYQILDSREKQEFEVSHLKGARWVGSDDFSLERVSELDPNQPIVIYCSIGYRSGKIAQQLAEQGFVQVFNLYGGIFEWRNEGLPVVDANGKSTNDVHAYNAVWGVWLNEEYSNKVYDE